MPSVSNVTVKSAHVCSKGINSTSGRKYLTENRIIDIDFLYDMEILAI